MKRILLYAALCLPWLAVAQQNPALEKRIHDVENNLAPNTVFGDSLPHLNLRKEMEKYHIKGVSIAVIENYRVDWARGYGWADEEEKRPVTTETRFQAASISKSLNSLGLLRLVQQGKIDLDADINQYLKTWKFPYDSVSRDKRITLHNLLSHSAGLTIHGFRGYEYGDSLPGIIDILDGKRPANSAAVRSAFEPSLRFQYSGGGTTISQLIARDVTGMPYDQYMKKYVLDPLGMTNSSYTQPPAAGIEKYLATGYYSSGQPVKGKYHIYPEQAAAGLWTTPTDLAKYIIECQLAYKGQSSKVLSQKWMRERMTPYVDSSAALGVFIEMHDGVRWFNHNGSNEAFLCTSYGSLEGGRGVVVMINGETYSIIGELVNSVAQVYGWKDFFKPEFRHPVNLSPDTMNYYTGNYLLGKDTLSVIRCGEHLCITQNGNPPGGFQMIFTSQQEAVIQEVPGLTLEFRFEGEQTVNTLVILQQGTRILATRIEGN